MNGVQVGDAKAVAALSGYVQQDDVFVGTLTVAEHLWFQSMLRMDRSLTDAERQSKVDEVIYEVCTSACINSVFVSSRRGLRSASRRRLKISRFRRSTFGTRALSVADLTVWNSLPDSIVV